ncbi:BgTH12-04376 [Blumeria graminis f. sp. triticale]|uniref:Bgt-1737 n=3 Tax=Blumeria graminis TaxID=34373 RepID=A0A061HR22_BLUGR|nr:hypothetical protein BGT96224_1737 [Blumeria graminis f. sp. tritici 96224]CAD6498715.1 BgTH12-04376 [Blumeria graminis f. sp. triticale]VCU38813.1 Bgt-1737 [Blumeria graminis f. sp. tritici]
MALIEFDPHNLQSVKLGCHCIQALCLVFIFVLELVVFSRATLIDGRVGWQFGLVFLTVPAILYLTMIVRFPRTRKFAQPYALATVDFFFAILWISGFSAQASYNSTNRCYGACGVSKAIVGLGFVTWIFWVLTTVMSLYGVMYWKREGYLPGVSRNPYNAAMIDPDKEAFSTAPHSDDYVVVHNSGEHETPYYSGVGNSPYTERPSGYVPQHIRQEEEETAYMGYTGADANLSGRVQFPVAKYENV